MTVQERIKQLEDKNIEMEKKLDVVYEALSLYFDQKYNVDLLTYINVRKAVKESGS